MRHRSGFTAETIYPFRVDLGAAGEHIDAAAHILGAHGDQRLSQEQRGHCAVEVAEVTRPIRAFVFGRSPRLSQSPRIDRENDEPGTDQVLNLGTAGRLALAMNKNGGGLPPAGASGMKSRDGIKIPGSLS